jgi:hypothetical protein
MAAESAASCGDEGLPIVELAFSGNDWEAELQRGIVKHLRAGLEPAGFRVCVQLTGQKPPVATVELKKRPGESIVATIEVRDGVTAKRVARDIDLSALPEDGRALGVGLAADELLRASWAELALTDAPKPVEPPPPAVQKTVERSLRRDVHPRSSTLGVRAAIEGYGGGLVAYGGDVAFRHWLASRFGGELWLGVRGAPAETSANGEVRARSFGAGGALFFEVVHPDDGGSFRLALEAGLWAARVELTGEARSGYTGTSGVESLITLRGGAAAGLVLSNAVSLGARAGLGGVTRAVTARDDGREVVSASGLEWYAALGPEVAF